MRHWTFRDSDRPDWALGPEAPVLKTFDYLAGLGHLLPLVCLYRAVRQAVDCLVY
jgi:hypothetical protein